MNSTQASLRLHTRPYVGCIVVVAVIAFSMACSSEPVRVDANNAYLTDALKQQTVVGPPISVPLLFKAGTVTNDQSERWVRKDKYHDYVLTLPGREMLQMAGDALIRQRSKANVNYTSPQLVVEATILSLKHDTKPDGIGGDAPLIAITLGARIKDIQSHVLLERNYSCQAFGEYINAFQLTQNKSNENYSRAVFKILLQCLGELINDAERMKH